MVSLVSNLHRKKVIQNCFVGYDLIFYQEQKYTHIYVCTQITVLVTWEKIEYILDLEYVFFMKDKKVKIEPAFSRTVSRYLLIGYLRKPRESLWRKIFHLEIEFSPLVLRLFSESCFWSILAVFFHFKILKWKLLCNRMYVDFFHSPPKLDLFMHHQLGL
jgi:hypothetical protein